MPEPHMVATKAEIRVKATMFEMYNLFLWPTAEDFNVRITQTFN